MATAIATPRGASVELWGVRKVFSRLGDDFRLITEFLDQFLEHLGAFIVLALLDEAKTEAQLRFGEDDPVRFGQVDGLLIEFDGLVQVADGLFGVDALLEKL